ncbi:MAG: 4'-phosphopantetheinyl transferase [Paracoccaceae bacterium]
MPDGADFLAALRGIAPDGAGIGWANPALDYPVMPAEVLQSASPARAREFAAGRAAARTALACIGVPPQAILHGSDRAPIWPKGVIGSITHTGQACLAIAMPVGPCRGVGIDLEDDSPLPRDLWDTILTPDEQIRMTGARAKAAFCAKEAAYKAQYPVSGTLYGFDRMVIDQTDDRFAATFTASIPPFATGDRVMGWMVRFSGHVLTLATV